MYRCLVFAEGARLDGKIFKVTGFGTRSRFYPELVTTQAPDPFKLSHNDPVCITLIKGGFYEFELTEPNFGSIRYNLGEAIEAFKANHPSLELEAITPVKMRSFGGSEVRVTSYYVSFRVKK